MHKIPVVKLLIETDNYISIDGEYDHVYCADNAKEIFQKTIGKNNVECVGMLCLDSDSKIINFSMIGIGEISNVRVSIAQILKVALLSNSVQIMIAHNHPSGVLNFTKEDIDVTKKIGKLASILGIKLIDSLIVVPKGDILSMRQNMEEDKDE